MTRLLYGRHIGMRHGVFQRNSVLTLVLAMLLTAALVRTAWGTPLLDPAAVCSLRLECRYEDRALSGAAARIFRVAAVDERAAYTLTAEFMGSGVMLTGLDSGGQWLAAATELSAWAEQHSLPPRAEQVTDSRGTAAFSSLEAGLYLVELSPLQTAAGRYTFTAFLAAVPALEDEAWNSAAVAQPKVAFDGAQKPSVPDRPTPDMPQPERPETPENRLPQTGQLRWPVPVLTVTGMGLLALGTRLTRRKAHA